MAYAQKSFFGYFGQNWAKIKNIFFGNSFQIEVSKKVINPQKFCLTKLISKKLVF
jgi:hypothetical protein